MHCTFKKYLLYFKQPAGTSRGWMRDKETYFLVAEDGGRKAYGECNLFKGLSADDRDGYENKVMEVCKRIPDERENLLPSLIDWPSIAFGVETLLLDIKNGFNQILFPEAFSNNRFDIPTNALVWMGSKEEMLLRIDEKLNRGYQCIKLKIGAIDFEKELDLLKYIRSKPEGKHVIIRLDANGAFSVEEAIKKLDRLSDFNIEYIEQPIKAGQWKEMSALIKVSPIPVALDEELVGIYSMEKKEALLKTLNPDVLILKPALTGGFNSCEEWQKALRAIGKNKVVITSALESNIGLNAIAQYTAISNPSLAQGLGTGQLYTNNIPAPYDLDAAGLHYNPSKKWNFSLLS